VIRAGRALLVYEKSSNNIDVYYCLDLLQHKNKQAHYFATLDQREQTIAGRFKREILTQRYILAHGLLREVLAKYVNESAIDLQFMHSEKGKPFLLNYPELSFNMSHTGDSWVLAVVQAKCHLGIDIEYFKVRESWQGLVKKCFSAEESEYWHGLPVADQGRFFYQLWVRKEAFVKALGEGITLGLDRCVVNSVEINQFLRLPECAGSVDNWQSYAFDIAPELLAAVVCNQKYVSLNLTELAVS